MAIEHHILVELCGTESDRNRVPASQPLKKEELMFETSGKKKTKLKKTANELWMSDTVSLPLRN